MRRKGLYDTTAAPDGEQAIFRVTTPNAEGRAAVYRALPMYKDEGSAADAPPLLGIQRPLRDGMQSRK